MKTSVITDQDVQSFMLNSITNTLSKKPDLQTAIIWWEQGQRDRDKHSTGGFVL